MFSHIFLSLEILFFSQKKSFSCQPYSHGSLAGFNLRFGPVHMFYCNTLVMVRIALSVSLTFSELWQLFMNFTDENIDWPLILSVCLLLS